MFYMTEPIRCLSMGAGVQTTALLLKFWERYKNGYIIFADTGDEKKETYWYVEKYLKSFCKEKGLRWQTVKHKDGFSLMGWCFTKRVIPFRSRRWCTEKFKISPINRFIKSLGATKNNPIYMDIGISLDESHRANFTVTKPLYVKNSYPLLDNKITRRECYEIIKEHGFPVPVKSGCDFCPYANRKEMIKLMAEQPERFHRIVEMEKNSKKYPKQTLLGNVPLAHFEMNQSLDDFNEEYKEDESTCDSGHCFT